MKEEKRLYATGACRFCGQICALKEDVETEQEANELATQSCVCEDALRYQYQCRRLDQASKAISGMMMDFGHESACVRPVLEVAAETIIQKKQLKKVVLQLENASYAVKDSGGVIQVIRTERVKELRE